MARNCTKYRVVGALLLLFAQQDANHVVGGGWQRFHQRAASRCWVSAETA